MLLHLHQSDTGHAPTFLRSLILGWRLRATKPSSTFLSLEADPFLLFSVPPLVVTPFLGIFSALVPPFDCFWCTGVAKIESPPLPPFWLTVEEFCLLGCGFGLVLLVKGESSCLVSYKPQFVDEAQRKRGRQTISHKHTNMENRSVSLDSKL